jgi:hypothetical protein
MSEGLRLIYRPVPSISPEQTRDARARGWSSIFQYWQENQMAAKVSQPGGPDDVRKDLDAHTATQNYT